MLNAHNWHARIFSISVHFWVAMGTSHAVITIGHMLACTTTFWTNAKDIETSISLITRILYLCFVFSVRGNGYQRVDVPDSRKIAGILPPLEWRGARKIGIDELQCGTRHTFIVFLSG
jgi:hypothetical protein